jgi:hypothetical protein
VVFSQRMWLRRGKYWGIVLAIGFGGSACQPAVSTAPPNLETRFESIEVIPEEVVMGQTLYVPVYSYVYQRNPRNPVMEVSATLSIRNTDLTHSLIVTSVRYYDNDGELLRTYVETPIEIDRLASADFLIESEDVLGGIGANFIVEWVAKTEITEPVVEALMISTTGNQGISFISPGRVIHQRSSSDAVSSDAVSPSVAP